jgi:hypothetical protein
MTNKTNPALLRAQLLELEAVADDLDLNANAVAWLWLKPSAERARWLAARRKREAQRAMRRKLARRTVTESIGIQLAIQEKGRQV